MRKVLAESELKKRGGANSLFRVAEVMQVVYDYYF